MEYSFKIPEEIPAGQYLVRLEHIAIHNAAAPRSAQYYTSCAQVEIASTGTGVPGPLVKIPGLYNETDPGLHFDRTFLDGLSSCDGVTRLT